MATHLEHISDQKFNSSFKNMLRDYYTYGFKDRADYTGALATYNSDRKRLNDFLKDYMEWSEHKQRKSATSSGKHVTFIACDSQSMDINPFHRVYRFCGTDRPEYLYYFFHTFAALNSLFQLSEGTDTLGLKDAAAARFESKLNIQEKKITRTVKSMHIGREIAAQLEQYYSDEEELIGKANECGLSDEQISKLRTVIRETTIKLKTSELIRFYTQNAEDINTSDTEPASRTANNRLQRLSDIGVVCCSQSGGENIFSEEQVMQIMHAIPDTVKSLLEKEDMNDTLEKALKNYSLSKPGDRNWYLSRLTIKRVLEAGQAVNIQFASHFQYALDFYSKTFLFGEIGTFLLDRMKADANNRIRIKHEYFMHSLNDFNAIDILTAIEKRKWCLISYKRDAIETKLLCYPIELRISSINGREYLMYYEPFKRSCAALRLEFVESIRYYQDHDVKKSLAQYYPEIDIELDIDQNLNRAKLLMSYTWGVSTGSTQAQNIENLSTMFRELRIRIAYDKDKDYYILNRLYRESRTGMICVNEEEGTIDFSVIAVNINEVIPFIRSFYARVISCTGFDEHGFSVEVDIKNIVGQIVNKDVEETDLSEPPREEIWQVDPEFLTLLGAGAKATAHEKLFNEMFSAYYHIFAAILGKVCNGTECYSEKEIHEICSSVMYEYKNECGPDMLWLAFRDGKIFAELLINGGFLLKEYHKGQTMYKSKYETISPVDLYKDVIPLSEVEVRWLKTIITDEKIHYFLSQKEILALKLLLAEMAIETTPFSMKNVNYYDRYKFSPKKEWRESAVIVPILDAIRDSHVVNIKYVSSKKNVVCGKYYPILMEFSKRDNSFKGYFLSCRRKEGLKVFNLAQCVSVENTQIIFDRTEVKKIFDSFQERQTDKVELEFEDMPNLADRILTEFSPWKKNCDFDAESGVYHLTIYYQKQDGKEMAIRLLALGKTVRLIDPNHRLSIIVQSKLRDQMDRIPKENARPAQSRERTGSTR